MDHNTETNNNLQKTLIAKKSVYSSHFWDYETSVFINSCSLLQNYNSSKHVNSLDILTIRFCQLIDNNKTI